MKKEISVFCTDETALGSILSDIVTFGFLLLCIWFSNNQGGGWWTFFTCCLFLISISAKSKKAEWIKLKSKKEAIEWANSLSENKAE